MTLKYRKIFAPNQAAESLCDGDGDGDGARIIREARNGPVAYQLTEFAFVFIGSVMVVLGGFIAGLYAVAGQVASFLVPFVPGVGLLGAGLVLFAYGTLGFRRQVTIDPKRLTISFGKANSSGECRVATILPLDQISSLYVSKVETAMGDAQLMLRTKHRKTPYTLLAGSETAMRQLHEEICQIVRSSRRSDRSLNNDTHQFDRRAAA